MGSKVEYQAFDKANNINTILKSIVKEDSLRNQYFLSGKYSDEGGFEIYKSFISKYSKPYLGPFIKVRTTAANTNWAKTASKIVITRINGTSYYTHFFVSIIIIVFVFFKSLTNYIDTGNLLGYYWQITPLLCGIYMLLIELCAVTSFNRLVNKIVDLVRNEGIEVNKIK